MIKVFFDTSVLFSAIYSSSGGSAKLVLLVKQKCIGGITTQTIINELEENVGKIRRFGKKDISQFVFKNNILVREEIKLEEIKPYTSIVEEKDAHVVAGAIITNCDYLLTLDKKHLDNHDIKRRVKKVRIISPKEMLQILTK